MENIVTGMALQGSSFEADIGGSSTSTLAFSAATAPIKYGVLDVAKDDRINKGQLLLAKNKVYTKDMQHMKSLQDKGRMSDPPTQSVYAKDMRYRKLLVDKERMSAPPTQSFKNDPTAAPSPSLDVEEESSAACWKSWGLACTIGWSALTAVTCLMLASLETEQGQKVTWDVLGKY
ncbi:uncharacterized protein MELLADRAFT_110601 [Melampsora larici-populina 98AG31]|uniref:Uncharacterized protein n=1 Tax=Melampsora larici-populina (strain 98AG31 / pathotype 3-4-7) TaxID=747676 RepID=F4S0C2_MELLP|nr:uncharacterized protein MELLADRAFT_110601 [Melampsora larici-populina 98AG31]EGG01961.1 hypothetical protein MELLADRAFT_110601 [Melampsora larici-populina 98AG31]